ncbi:DUF6300 family protein [Streptomyces sp. AK02-04a]
MLLARYPHSWRNNKGGTVSGFRGSVLCRVCDLMTRPPHRW